MSHYELRALLLRWALLFAVATGSGWSHAATDIDARSVTLGSVSQSYCTSIDGVDYSSTQYFRSAADVLAKTGLTIQSQNTGNVCCTAAKPWNGAACVAPIICPTGQELVSGVCTATTNSCAAIGKVLIGGSCQLAAPPCTNPTLQVQSFYPAPSSDCFTYSGTTSCTFKPQDLSVQGISKIAPNQIGVLSSFSIGTDGKSVSISNSFPSYMGSACGYHTGPQAGCLDGSNDVLPLRKWKYYFNIDNIAKYNVYLSFDTVEIFDLNVNGYSAFNSIGGDSLNYSSNLGGVPSSVRYSYISSSPTSLYTLSRRSSSAKSTSSPIDITQKISTGTNIITVSYVDYGAFTLNAFGSGIDTWSAGSHTILIKPKALCY